MAPLKWDLLLKRWYSHPRKFGTAFIFESSTKTFLGGAVHDIVYIVYTIIYSITNIVDSLCTVTQESLAVL